MSSSLARTRSLRKPTQGSSTDLPPAPSTSAASASTTATAGSTGAAAPSTSAQRPVSPSRLPAPRSLAPPRPATRSVSGASTASTSDATKKKKPNSISTLLGRVSSTRQPAGTTSTRQKDAAAGTSVGSGPPSAPLSRTSALSGLTRSSSTRDPGSTRARHPSGASTSNVGPSGTSAAARSTTTTRPTTSGGLPASRLNGAASSTTSSPTKGHARARSVATLNGSTVLRPPSQTSSSDRGGPAPARSRPTSLYGAPPAFSTTTATTTTRPRPPSATDRLSSKPSISSLSSATTTATTRPTRAASTSTAPPKPFAKQHQLSRHQQASPASPPRPPKPPLRPAFNTLQQHYSPAKSLAPKPLTATYLAPPSPSKLPTNVALTAETARLQTELLQLHLLHRDLPQTTVQWHASARSKLAARHASLGKSSADLASHEADAAERLNVAALQRWGASPATTTNPSPSGRGATLEDKIQRLDALLTFLWSLDAPGGKHNRLVRAFERWASTLPDLEAARARAENSGDPSALLDADLEVRFGGGLDARWKEEAAALVRRLEGWAAQLRELEYVEEEDGASNNGEAQVSSLKRMLDGSRSLVRDMLDELAVMGEIEAAAVKRESEWIRRMNREGDDGRGKDTPRAGAVWRVV